MGVSILTLSVVGLLGCGVLIGAVVLAVWVLVQDRRSPSP